MVHGVDFVGQISIPSDSLSFATHAATLVFLSPAPHVHFFPVGDVLVEVMFLRNASGRLEACYESRGVPKRDSSAWRMLPYRNRPATFHSISFEMTGPSDGDSH